MLLNVSNHYHLNLLLYHPAVKMHPKSSKTYESLEQNKQQFTYSNVLKMTNNFERVIGKGGFGTVYYGRLDDTEVAVKMLSQSSAQGFKQFQSEVSNS